MSTTTEDKGEKMSVSQTLEEMSRLLPPNLQQEVEDFIQFLIERQRQKHGRILRQDWVGAIRDYRDQYTSLELQKKALEWRRAT